MHETLYEKLLRLPKPNLINLMWAALDEMRTSNTRTRTACIVEALGGEIIHTANGAMRYKLPTLDVMKEITKTMNL